LEEGFVCPLREGVWIAERRVLVQ